MSKNDNKQPLATQPIPKLIRQFAIPAIIANVVNALYNIVDQIFIGNGVGYLGNAATNIAFPITTISLALALLIGVGAASNFNLEMGRGNKELAKKIVGNNYTSLVLTGLVLMAITLIFVKPLMLAFGATAKTLDYAVTYASITAYGLPFLMLPSGGNPLIRSDGSPRYSMTAVLSGAIVNTILDPIFIFGFGWGMAGAAWATVIGQAVSGIMVLNYLRRFKQVPLDKEDFKIKWTVLLGMAALGLTAMFNQVSATIVQLVTNNLLNNYGPKSAYGADIPIAIAGITAKLNMIFTSVILGLTQGAQPILGFNFGAKNIARVKEAYIEVIKFATIVSLLAWGLFQLFAPQIIQIFGSANGLYLSYGVKYLRGFMALLFLNGMQINSTTFFSSIGKARTGAFLAIIKQLLLLVPFSIIIVLTMGVGNIMYAAPIADFLSWAITMLLIWHSFKRMTHPQYLD